MTRTSLSDKTFKNNIMFMKKLLLSMEHRIGNVLDHSESVGLMAVVIAKKMGIKDKKKLMDIQYGAFFHDIGKISISKRILHKTASLSKHEYAVMKTHASIGYELTNALPRFKGIAKIIHQHHESWDGTGYPHNLKGRKICLGARICAVVDSFHAMSSNRRYSLKKPLTLVLNELNKCSGSKYDPEVVAAFNGSIKEIERILKKNKEDESS